MKTIRFFLLSLSFFLMTGSNFAQTSKLSGTYTIGTSSGANYAAFSAAMNALQSGIDSPVTFLVESGTYSENIVIPDVQGTSQTNTITFKSISGNASDVVITGTGPGGTSTSIFKVNGSDYVTVENMSFIPINKNFAYNIHILNMSRHFTLRNCILTAEMSVDYNNGMRHVYTQAENTEDHNNDFITIENCTITGGYIGLYIGGTSYVALSKERGAVIRNNTLLHQGSKGIYTFDEKDALIENNIVISETTTRSDYQAIDMFRPVGNMIIRNNKINISQSIYSKGIFIRTDAAGTSEMPLLVYNNSISIQNAPASTYGICITSDCRYIHLIYNSININGNGGCCFGVTGNYTNITEMVFQNNLVQNNTVSPVLFFSKDFQYQAFDFKNNAYYCAGQSFTNNWGDNFETWVSNSGETNSFIEKAVFVSATDLHLQEQGGLNASLPVSFIISDLEGKQRSATTPTIGSYEFGNIVVETPEMADGYPIITNVTHNSVQAKVKSNQSGVIYYMARKLSETELTVDEVIALSPHIAVDQMIETVISVLDLSPQTEYKIYFVVVSTSEEKSELIVSELFTTQQYFPPLEVSLQEIWGPIPAGTAITLSANAAGGKEPYLFSWKNSQGETLSTEVSLTLNPMISGTYYLAVTDALTNNIHQKTIVYVTGNQSVATFDDLALEPESAWFGDPENEETLIFSGSYSFTNTYIKEWQTWGGFSYSNMTETTFDPEQMMTHQFHSVVGSGVNFSENYSVVYPSEFHPTNINVLQATEGDSVSGVYVTNSAYTMNSMMHGDPYMGEAFQKGDFYKVIFTGTAKDGSRSTVEYYLSDYRSENEAEHYAITTWQWVDLSALGKIKSLVISIDASRFNQWGLTLPTYFCMDDFGAAMPIDAEIEMSIKIGVPENLTLSEFFDFDDFNNVTYSVLSVNDENITANINGDILTVVANQATHEGEILVSTTQKGVTKYGLIHISTTNAITEASNNGFSIFPIPAHDVLNVHCQYTTYQMSVYDLLGRIVLTKESSGDTQIDVNQLHNGVYILEITKNGQRFIQRFIKK